MRKRASAGLVQRHKGRKWPLSKIRATTVQQGCSRIVLVMMNTLVGKRERERGRDRERGLVKERERARARERKVVRDGSQRTE